MQIFSTLVLPFLLVAIPLYGLIKRVAIYEEFVAGASEGFATAVRIIPYLVAILFAIAMFRASGAMEMLMIGIKPVLDLVGFPAEVLPMALTRPLTGSGSVGVLADLINTHGADSMIVKMAATMFGSTETTFYVIAVYFGAVGVRKTAYAIQAGLIADLVGIIASVTVCYWLFG
ncbi:MAG: spore maturation protein [Gammaproteobacteria bacterium]|nr:spore maturation protein [Gammaproteobacteria bacterium]